MTDLAEIEAALKAATPGPWEASPDNLVPGRAAILPSWSRTWCEIPDAHLIANAPTWLAELLELVKAGVEDVRAFSEALGFGDGRTEPAASLEELIDPLRDAMRAARDHYECPVVCERCGERLASQACKKCHGSGCLPNPEMAYLECDECAGSGKVHSGCAEAGYADLADRVKAAEEWRDTYHRAATREALHVQQLLDESRTAEATIARVRALADRFDVAQAALGLGSPNQVAAMIRAALNGTRDSAADAQTGADAPSDERNRFSGDVCRCRACNPEANWMVVCSICGNKRCPHAWSHENRCTRSNEPNQAPEPILRPTDQRYEPPADDHESGCCR